MPRAYRGRQSREDAWRQRYGGDALEHADAVLEIVCDAFNFNPESRYQLTPDDRIADIYRSLYPPRRFWPRGDSMEIERLLIALDEDFGFGISNWHKDITIAEIVDNIVQVAGGPGDSAAKG